MYGLPEDLEELIAATKKLGDETDRYEHYSQVFTEDVLNTTPLELADQYDVPEEDAFVYQSSVYENFVESENDLVDTLEDVSDAKDNLDRNLSTERARHVSGLDYTNHYAALGQIKKDIERIRSIREELSPTSEKSSLRTAQ